jgi:nitrous oxide reductase accessory protein NosL
MRRILLTITAALVMLAGLQSARAADAALTGKVTSAKKGRWKAWW